MPPFGGSSNSTTPPHQEAASHNNHPAASTTADQHPQKANTSTQPHSENLNGKMQAGWDDFTGWIGENVVDPAKSAAAPYVYPTIAVVAGLIAAPALFSLIRPRS